jgi:hypothetical protein
MSNPYNLSIREAVGVELGGKGGRGHEMQDFFFLYHLELSINLPEILGERVPSGLTSSCVSSSKK